MIGSPRQWIRAAAGSCGLLLLAACATGQQEERINAVKDFVEVAGLAEVDSVRTLQDIEQEVLNDEFVILRVGKQDFLLEYARRCREDPFTQRLKPDVRYDANHLYAHSDTYRGCQIKALYAITPGQVEELRTLGAAPGE